MWFGGGIQEIGTKAFYNSPIACVNCWAENPPVLGDFVWGWDYYYNGDDSYSYPFDGTRICIPYKKIAIKYRRSEWMKYVFNGEFDYYFTSTEENYEDYEDYEYDSYLALGGDPEKYSKGILDSYMDYMGY